MGPVRAITFDVSVPRYLLGKTLGPFTDLAVFGPPSGVRLREVPEPSLPGPRWARLEVILCGICGSDIGNLTFESSPALEPFASFPAVLGHEILARVIEVGPAVMRVRPGDRVVIDPILSCVVRGYPEDSVCRSCEHGLPGTCERAGEEGPLQLDGRPLARGLTMGYHRDLPGGWAERIIAHESQLHPVSDALDDRVAVLTEPLSVGVHAVLRAPPAATDTVLVIGSGPIALGTIWALRALGFTGRIVAQAKRKHEAELAQALGADEAVAPGAEARDALMGTGASAYMPLIGPEVYAGGGFTYVFDCVGSAETLDQALRFASPRGRIALLGCAGHLRGLDLTFLWARELTVIGFLAYGVEEWRGERVHTFEVTQRLLLEGASPVGGSVASMVTEIFPLSHYRDALAAAAHRARSGAIKVLLSPR
ncbi:MAG: alcohol dehydrogenase catalytic domain-containing protein [Gemmatimonadetes bacterium]|nr:alcohol dehydrogenase catalytic domain-containing protein [Gemmatimonadota bacterium]